MASGSYFRLIQVISASALVALGIFAQQTSNSGSALVKVNPKDAQRYVWIEPGNFTLGCSQDDRNCAADETPARTVEITHGFWMAETPATVAAWKRYRGETGKPALMPADEFGRKLNEAAENDLQPAVGASWNEASDYCHWAGLRLPTEAEWEFAARAGTSRSTYEGYGELEPIAWFADNSGRKPLESSASYRDDPSRFPRKLLSNLNGPRPVKLKKANAWGLYDMLGNVWEWVADYYSPTAYADGPAKDPVGPSIGSQRVLRGGAWSSIPANVRVSYRLTNPPGDHVNSFGFRCAGNLR